MVWTSGRISTLGFAQDESQVCGSLPFHPCLSLLTKCTSDIPEGKIGGTWATRLIVHEDAYGTGFGTRRMDAGYFGTSV